MLKKVKTVSPDITIKEAVKIMVKNKTNSLVVIDGDKKPVGILSSYTLAKEVVPVYLKDDPISSNYEAEGTFDRYAEKIKDKQVGEIMYKEFHSLNENDPIIEAASYAVEASRRILPVVDKDGRLIGAVTRTCLKNALFDALFKKSPKNQK